MKEEAPGVPTVGIHEAEGGKRNKIDVQDLGWWRLIGAHWKGEYPLQCAGRVRDENLGKKSQREKRKKHLNMRRPWFGRKIRNPNDRGRLLMPLNGGEWGWK